MDLKASVRAIPDFPKPGIIFRDVTTLMGDGAAFAQSIDLLVAANASRQIDAVAGIEARGFVFGAALAHRLGCGFVPVRKTGKLPAPVHRQSYLLEYGEDTLEVHQDALRANDRTLLVDDLLATGGTAAAAVDLLRAAGAVIVGSAFVIELPELGGRAVLEAKGVEVLALIQFEGH